MTLADLGASRPASGCPSAPPSASAWTRSRASTSSRWPACSRMIPSGPGLRRHAGRGRRRRHQGARRHRRRRGRLPADAALRHRRPDHAGRASSCSSPATAGSHGCAPRAPRPTRERGRAPPRAAPAAARRAPRLAPPGRARAARLGRAGRASRWSLRLIDARRPPVPPRREPGRLLLLALPQTGDYQYNPLLHGPLRFYLTALMYVLFGDSDFTARLAPALMGTAMVPLLLAAARACSAASPRSPPARCSRSGRRTCTSRASPARTSTSRAITLALIVVDLPLPRPAAQVPPGADRRAARALASRPRSRRSSRSS